MSALRLVALVSGIYDVVLGLALLTMAPTVATLFGAPPVVPPVFAETNGLFLICIGLGYWQPWTRPASSRWYVWLMGVGLKGTGALLFIADAVARASPPAWLLFACTDGTLALWSWIALRQTSHDAV